MARSPLTPLAALLLTVALVSSAACSGPRTITLPRPSVADSPLSQPLATSPSPVASERERSYRGVTTDDPRLKILNHPMSGSSKEISLSMLNPLGQPLVLLISDERTDPQGRTWYEVYIPERPNEGSGWVPERSVEVVPLSERIEVDLSDLTLELFREDQLVVRSKVGIGQRQWPTPVGTFFVWAKVPQSGATGVYGVYALGLSGFSPVLSDWPGGGRAAIHGTAAPGDRGRRISHGCVRVFNPDMRILKHVPMGTPVIIRR